MRVAVEGEAGKRDWAGQGRKRLAAPAHRLTATRGGQSQRAGGSSNTRPWHHGHVCRWTSQAAAPRRGRVEPEERRGAPRGDVWLVWTSAANPADLTWPWYHLRCPRSTGRRGAVCALAWAQRAASCLRSLHRVEAARPAVRLSRGRRSHPCERFSRRRTVASSSQQPAARFSAWLLAGPTRRLGLRSLAGMEGAD